MFSFCWNCLEKCRFSCIEQYTCDLYTAPLASVSHCILWFRISIICLSEKWKTKNKTKQKNWSLPSLFLETESFIILISDYFVFQGVVVFSLLKKCFSKGTWVIVTSFHPWNLQLPSCILCCLKASTLFTTKNRLIFPST